MEGSHQTLVDSTNLYMINSSHGSDFSSVGYQYNQKKNTGKSSGYFHKDIEFPQQHQQSQTLIMQNLKLIDFHAKYQWIGSRGN